MPNPEKMTAAVQAYFDCFNARDADGIVAFFADDATVNDPHGTPPKAGKNAIREFYTMAVKNGATLAQQGQTRIVHDTAAFAFTVTVGGAGMTDTAVDVDLPSGGMTIHVIDTFKFNEDDQVVEMRAFWGPTNIVQG